MAACCLIATQALASTTQMCRPYQHMSAANRLGQAFIIRNDNYGGQWECMSNSGGQPNFVVTQSSDDSGSRPAAFPYIFLGCSWGLCTTGSGLPARVSALHEPQTTWDISQHAGGTWDATYDIWFDQTRITTGQATGGELMIWLNSHGLPAPGPRTPIVWEDHARWYLQSWITHHAGHKWRIIQFRRVKPTGQVVNLDLSAFIHRAENHDWIRSSYWMLNIDAGFEIWRNGNGLATNYFAARG